MTMIKLTQVTIDKYKSIQNPQTVDIDTSITTIVGMNEAGKTSFLTAIAKTNYFISDSAMHRCAGNAFSRLRSKRLIPAYRLIA
jgi:AAA15 family ATPase/GTPase